VLGLRSLYVADLDAIAGCPPRVDLYRELVDLGLELWIDAGLRDASSAAPLLDLGPGNLRIVAGLETINGPRELGRLVDRAGADRVIFSLDLFEGRPRVGAGRAWGTDDPEELAHRAIDQGISHVLIIDLARVGTGGGLGTERLMAQVHQAHPEVAISVGGGLSRIEDALRLRDAGASGVLIGSAIHGGRIGRRELDQIASQ
jgi:phosphoribosylformimino-5-aminoimidazole carboxamide ribotide isomerase